MTWLRVWLSRALELVRRRRRERELEEEIAAHLDFLTEEHRRAGLSPSEARAAARRDFGAIEPLKERYREQRGLPFFDSLHQDCRFAVRRLAKDRWFTVVAVVTLALGIAVTNTVFTFVNATRLRGLPSDGAGRVVSIRTADASGRKRGASLPDFRDWRAGTTSFDAVAAYHRTRMNVGDEERVTEQFPGLYISADGFRALGVTPILGRDFVDDDDRPGAPSIVMLGASLWKGRYGSDPGIVGHTLTINGVSSVVVGVLPEGFKFDFYAELWQPLALSPDVSESAFDRGRRVLGVVGRLGDGATLTGAQSELRALGERLGRDHPDTNEGMRPVASPFTGRLTESPMQMALLGAVGFVLLIACANVAGLLLTRSTRRSREIALRVSLGASRGRVIRQLFVESAILTGLAGIAGAGLSVLGVALFARSVEAIAKPYWIDFTMDSRVVWFLIVVCAITAVLFPLVPALHTSKTNVTLLKEGGPRNSAGPRARRWTSVLLSAELALTLVLLAGAGLLVRSFFNIYRLDRIVDTAGLTTMGLQLPDDTYPTPRDRLEFFDELQRNVGADPRVAAVTLASMMPFADVPVTNIEIDAPGFEDDTLSSAGSVLIGPRYFETLGIGLLRGRTFTPLDGSPGHEVAIVNQRFVSTYLRRAEPLGRRIRLVDDEEDGRWLTIVGVSPTIRQRTFREPDPVVYLPAHASPRSAMRLLVRSSRSATDVTSLLRDEVRKLDRDLALYGIMSMDELMSQSRWPHRIFGAMASVFALIALLMSAVGLYAVTSYTVSERTRDIGVCMALGARARQVRGMVLGRTLTSLAAGGIVGMTGAVAVGWLLQSVLVLTSATDAALWISIVVLSAAASAAGCYAPVRRATRVDPVIALRHE